MALFGVVMFFGGRFLGPWFCRRAKRFCKRNIQAAEMACLYNEEEAPRIFRLLGVVNIIQGLFIFMIGILLK